MIRWLGAGPDTLVWWNMTLHIPDDILQRSGLDAKQLAVELACRLFDIGRLDLPTAARLAGVERVAFETALRDRSIALYRPTLGDIADEAAALAKLREMKRPA